jgi:hypothetical protein
MRTTIVVSTRAARSITALAQALLISGGCALLCAPLTAQQPGPTSFTTAQSITDEAQRTTLAFAGLGMMTGNLDAQSFFPPGKVADYTGFQYLRDNDPDNMGHNTSFLTRVANNVIYILNDRQFAQLKTLAVAQLDQIDLYGYKRYPLMKAFRRLIDGDIPSGSTGLSLGAVKKASRELYLLDGQISFDRALLYANILSSLDSTQAAYLAAMKGKGWKSWPDVTDDQIRSRMSGLPQGTAVAVMTYASDLFSWYAGSVEADVYFCPERHGTYFGSFYIKDAPAVGHEGYSIDEQLTATAGAALSDSTAGYVTGGQASLISSLVETQRNNLYAGSTNIVQARTQIATLLRGLLATTASSDAVKAQVLALSETYGDLDGENNYAYATVFAEVYGTLTSEQKAKLTALRKSIMSGKYADGTAFDFSICTTPFLYSSVANTSLLEPYIADTDFLFDAAKPAIASFAAAPASVAAGKAVTLNWSVTGATALTIDNGVGSVLNAASKQVSPTVTTTYKLTASNSAGSVSAQTTVTVTAAAPVISSFKATPASIQAGQSATLAWTVTGATTLSIDGGVGNVLNTSSRAVSPSQTTTYTLTAGASGASVSSSLTVTVTPARDTQPPTAPTLRPAAARSDRVDLEWSASTDNVGVTGYQIFRDGTSIGAIPAATHSYSDTRVAGTTGYTYMVKAIDAAGNLSAPSNAVRVTTPAPPRR